MINAGVGFSTFAVGDALSQGARQLQQPQIVFTGRRQQQQRQQEQQEQQSWQQQFMERCDDCEAFLRYSVRAALV